MKASMWVNLPSGGAVQFEKQITNLAETELEMSVGAVRSEDPSEHPVLKRSSLILQSPDVSVAITVSTSNRSNRAMIRVERTCYYDAMVPWKPYWLKMKKALQAKGYHIHAG